MAGIRLARDEAWRALAAAHTGIFVSLRRDGVPIALPVWFVAISERIYVSAPAHTNKIARVRADDRVSFLIESGERWSELSGVHLTGRASEVSDPAVLDAVAAALHAKYAAFRIDRAAMPDDTRAYYERATTTIEIVADARILSWDNARVEKSESR